MNKLLIFMFAIAIVAPGCTKSNKTTTTYLNTATIRELNLTMPACGASYFITIHGITDSNAQFNALPSGSGIDLTTATFPINVKINWHHNTGNVCDTAANIITIDAAASID